MFYQEIFDKYLFQSEKALQYGFIQTQEVYHLRHNLKTANFSISVTIADAQIQLKVFEGKEEYLPFFARSAEGGFVAQIREEAEQFILDMVEHCFEPVNLREKLLEYVLQKFHSEPDYPWDDKFYCTIRTPKANKWYGIFMYIPYRALGIDKEGKIDVLNVKADPAQIPNLIDKKHYFPAYHMSKKHWLSILLDSGIDEEKVQNLLEQSYRLVEGISAEEFREI